MTDFVIEKIALIEGECQSVAETHKVPMQATQITYGDVKVFQAVYALLILLTKYEN